MKCDLELENIKSLSSARHLLHCARGGAFWAWPATTTFDRLLWQQARKQFQVTRNGYFFPCTIGQCVAGGGGQKRQDRTQEGFTCCWEGIVASVSGSVSPSITGRQTDRQREGERERERERERETEL